MAAARMERSVIRERTIPDYAEFTIGPAHRVRPLAGPMAGSGRTRWLHPGYRRNGVEHAAVSGNQAIK
jgi:hypothetical protein